MKTFETELVDSNLQSSFFGLLTLQRAKNDNDFTNLILNGLRLAECFTLNTDYFKILEQNIEQTFCDHEDFSVINNESSNGKCLVHKSTEILGTIFSQGTSVIGPECVIGPNTFIRNGVIVGKGCRLGFCTEIKSSIICDGVVASHNSYIGHSIVGSRSIIGAGSIMSARRLDDNPVTIRGNGWSKDTRFAKFGSIIEKGCKLPISTNFMPGHVEYVDV